MSNDTFKQLVSTLDTKAKIYKHFDVPCNGTYTRLINKKIYESGAILATRNRFKYKPITKQCPVCGDDFKTQENHPKETHTCSYACSNTYFRSGTNNGSHQKAKTNNSTSYNYYRTLCFSHHKKECCICGEHRIVEVHHFDEDHSNNEISNLIPLCPLHHKLYHSRYKGDVEQQIIEYHQDHIHK